MTRLACYLHTWRRRWGLSQTELAHLLGYKDWSPVSRLEQRDREPSLAVAFACHVIFGADPIELFSGLFSEVEEGVVRRAYNLHERLQGNPSKKTRDKLALLEDALNRAKERIDLQTHE